MTTFKKIEQLQNRTERFQKEGKYESIQEFGRAYFKRNDKQVYEIDPYNSRQNFLYKRALYGLSIYTPEEIKVMSYKKRERIEKVHKRTQHELNMFKQNRLIELTNSIFSMFNKSTLCKELISTYSAPDPKFLCKVSFKELGISKDDIVNRLIDKKILYHNFHSLKVNAE